MKVVRLISILCSVAISFAYVDHPIAVLRDGSKSAFIQAPYINTIQDKLEGMQKEVSLYWPKGIVPYQVDSQSYGPNTILLIENAISIIQSSSCIKFQPLSDDARKSKTWMHISNPKKERECVHEPTYKENGEIMLVMGYDCLHFRDILHTLLHGIGFKDEVTHPHRDKYIRVIWNNIHPGYRHLYRKQPLDASKKVAEYDPLSVMQFHDRAFSVNGKVTIAALEPGLTISPSDGLSQLDKMRLNINFIHECNKRKVDDLLEMCKTGLQDGNKMAGEEEGQKMVEEDEGKKKAAEDEGQKLAEEDEVQKMAGEDDGQKLAEEDEGQKKAGEDVGQKLPEGDEGQKMAGEDEGQKLAEEDEGQKVVGEDEGKKLAGEDEDQKLAGEDEGKKLAGEDEDQKLAGEDEGKKLAGEDEDQKLAGVDEGQNWRKKMRVKNWQKKMRMAI